MKKYPGHIFHYPGFRILFFLAFFAASALLNAQPDKKYIRQGNRNYEKNDFSESEILYRRALDNNKEASDAIFNIGDALYKQDKFEDAGKQFIEHVNRNEDSKKKSEGLYNLGNSLLMANKVKESIDAYKGSLKMYPDNMEAKYNLAVAQDMLKQQEQQQKQQQQKNEESKNQGDQNKDQKGENDENQNQQNQEKQEKQDSRQGNISKEDAERLLNALANDEKKVQEKVKLAKASSSKSRTLKNW